MAFRAPRMRCRTIPFSLRSSSWLMAKLVGMKYRMKKKKKKRQRPSSAGSQNPNPTIGQIDDHSRVLNGVEEGIASVSVQEHAAAAEIIETPSSSIVNRDDDFAESFRNLTETEADLTFSEEDEGSGMIIDLRGHSVEIALLLLKIQLSICSLIGYVGKVTVIT